MKIKQIVFIFFLTFFANSYSQSYSPFYKRSQLDSLSTVLVNQKGNDRIKTMLVLAESFRYFQLDTAQLYVTNARREAMQSNFSWGVCKSYFTESIIQFWQGKRNVEEVKYIKDQCADWFYNNNYFKDALNARLGRNRDAVMSENITKVFKKAKLNLKTAQNLGDPQLLGMAWNQINTIKVNLYDTSAYYAYCADSTIFYLELAGDSLNLTGVVYSNLMNKMGGKIPKAAISRLEEIANRWQNYLLLIRVNTFKSYPYAVRGMLDSSVYYVNERKSLQRSFGGSILNTMTTSDILALAFQQQHNYHDAIEYYTQIITETKKYGVLSKLAKNYYKRGNCYFTWKEYDQAIADYLESLVILKRLGYYYLANSIQRSLADLYVLTGKNRKAESLYLEVIDWANQRENDLPIRILLGNSHNKIAKLCSREGKYDKALYHFEQSCENFSYNQYRLILPMSNLLEMYLDKEDIDSANLQHQNILEKIKEKVLVGSKEFYFEQGRFFMALKKYSEGISSLNSFLNLKTTNEVSEEHKTAHFLLYKAHKAQGQKNHALKSLESFKMMEDSLESSQVIQNVQEMQSNYELELKESEIKRLEQEQKISELKYIEQDNKLALRKQYIIILIFVFTLLAALGYLIFKRFQVKKENEKSEIKKRLEIESLRAQQKTELAEVKNNLYANISHEFKTPLTLIRVPIENMMMSASEDEKIVYNSIIQNTDYLLEMIDELLGVSNMESISIELNRSNFNITKLLSQIKLNFKPLFAQKHIQFDWYTDLGQDYFYGDENKLNIVISNLLKNAFSNSAENGWVKCTVQFDHDLKITVSNKGEHINSDDLPHIFERFYRGNNSNYPGSGIGLAWSKQIVELHNGTISVQNSLNDEVSFSVLMPVIEESKMILPTAITSEDKTLINNIASKEEVCGSKQSLPHVLVVEDNTEMQNLLKQILKADFRLDFANNGKIGEEMAIRLQPDLVLSDVMMPEKDGFELLKSLKENFYTSHIPVVLLTARADSESRVIGLNQDADDYIGKPFNAIELKSRINNLLRQRRNLHKLFSENPLLYSREVKCTPIDADFIDRARKILKQHFSNGDFSVSEFCTELALNRTGVNTKIRALANQSTSEYIKNFRLVEATKMLLKTNLSISVIYIDTGFNNIQVFNKSFKSKFHCTPTEFRANNKKNN